MAEKSADKAPEPKKADKNACIYCGHKNDEDAAQCGGCGIGFKA